MKKSMSDFEHISLLSFILRFLTFALYSYGVLVSGKNLIKKILTRVSYDQNYP